MVFLLGLFECDDCGMRVMRDSKDKMEDVEEDNEYDEGSEMGW